jgi:hypothetical protein
MINVALMVAFCSGMIFGWLAATVPNQDPWWPALIPAGASILCAALLHVR